jgi:hypothetical protein
MTAGIGAEPGWRALGESSSVTCATPAGRKRALSGRDSAHLHRHRLLQHLHAASNVIDTVGLLLLVVVACRDIITTFVGTCAKEFCLR